MCVTGRVRRVCGCLLPLLGLATAFSCRSETPTSRYAGGPLRVFVSILPQKCFVDRVGGGHVEVSVLLPPGQSPATYEPSPRQMVALGEARVYFRVGVPFETQVVAKIRSALPDLEMVDTCEGIELRAMAPGEHHHHDGEAHGHGDEQDPHVWMNPRLVKAQARTICRSLCRLDPVHRADYERNCDAFEAELDRVDREIAASLSPFRGRAFYVFHPSLGYFAEAYGLEQVAIETGGKQPAARELTALIRRAKASGVRLLFVQPQFDRRTAETVAREIGGAVVPLDPLAEDYVSNLRHVASQIAGALGGVAPAGAGRRGTTAPATGDASRGS